MSPQEQDYLPSQESQYQQTHFKPNQISFSATITEDELRERLGNEVLQSIGAMGPDGKPHQGVTVKVNRGDGRKGGYKITVNGPMPAQLLVGKE